MAGLYKLTQVLSGPDHPSWRGGKWTNSQGYVYVWNREHPLANNRGYIFEHRIVWEEHHKAILLPWATIHHKNHNRSDNRIENLEVYDSGKHAIYHLEERRYNEIIKRKCSYCGGDTRQRIKHCRGYVYYYADWNRHPLNKSEWLCATCYQNEYRKLYGRTN